MTTHRLRSLHGPLVAAALLVPATLTGAAGAASVRVTAGPDPTAEAGVPFRVTGFADGDAEAEARWIRRPSGCDDAVGGTQRIVPAGPFTIDAAADIDEPGDYKLCAVINHYGSLPETVAEVAIRVRAPRTAVTSLRLPAVVPLGTDVTVRAAGTSEAERHVTTVIAEPGTSCREATGGTESVGGGDEAGPGAWAAEDGGSLDAYGVWTACVVVRRHYASDPVDQLIARPVRVSQTCTRDTLLATAAKDRWADPARDANGVALGVWRRITQISRTQRALARTCDAGLREWLTGVTP